MDLLALVLFWLLIMGLATFGVFSIGLALISWVVESESKK
jgi:hypothetical protein